MIAQKNHISVKTGGEPFKVPLPPKEKVDESTSEVLALKQNKTRGKVIQREQQQNISSLPLVANGGLQPIIEQMQLAEQARAGAQETFLRVSQGMTQTLEQAINMQMQ